MSFKSGVVHNEMPAKASDTETGAAWMQAIKDKYFDGGVDKVYKAPVDGHHWELVDKGMKCIDEHGNVTWVTYLTEVTNHIDMNDEPFQKKFRRYKEICTGCTACGEMGFLKAVVR